MLRGLRAAPQWVIAGLSAILIALAAAADWYSGNDIAFTAIYLLPISLAAWLLSRGAMVFVTLLCAGAWLWVDAASHEFAQHPVVELINVAFELGIFLGFGFLLSYLRRALEAAQQSASTDALTGLENRRAFWTAAGEELERCRRFGQSFSIAYIDVDDFKGVNDRFGHRVGDELLQAIANTLRRAVRRVDTAARLGGDEFALLLPGTDAAGASVLLVKVRDQLAADLQATFRVGCSIGCLSVVEAPDDVDELVAHADALMYAAKRDRGANIRHATWPAVPGRSVPQRQRVERASGDVAS